jgi:hypothetical protein
VVAAVEIAVMLDGESAAAVLRENADAGRIYKIFLINNVFIKKC